MSRSWFHRMRTRADGDNRENILRMLEVRPGDQLLDLGCDDGEWTRRLGANAPIRRIGLDHFAARLASAADREILAVQGDLSRPLPFPDGRFDWVHANQVIEHVPDLDLFVSEVRRVLVSGGRAVVSTENLASWCNTLSLLLGWQPFSATNVSGATLGLGNPLAVNRGEKPLHAGWLHVHVLAYRAWLELFEAHGLELERIAGAGYFPLPSRLGRWDPRHAHFLAFRVRKL